MRRRTKREAKSLMHSISRQAETLENKREQLIGALPRLTGVHKYPVEDAIDRIDLELADLTAAYRELVATTGDV